MDYIPQMETIDIVEKKKCSCSTDQEYKEKDEVSLDNYKGNDDKMFISYSNYFGRS